MRERSSTRFTDLAYLVVLSLLIIFLLLTTVSIWQKNIPHKLRLISALLFGLGYLSCLYLSNLIFSPMRRLIGRSGKNEETAAASSSMRELMEDLRLSREEAKRWNRELERMASCIAHEIRNPLAVISTAGGYLKRVATNHKPLGGSESSQVEEQLEIIDMEIERVQKTIDGLLMFSRVSTSPSHPELVNINEVVEEALSQSIQAGCLNGIEVVKEITPSLLRVKIDPSELLQVFLNITRNAGQAMPDGGGLTITTKPAGKPNWVEISFSDTGCGIAQEDIEKVFRPFFTGKRFGEGTGLGLAIAEGIVKRTGGEIVVKSKIGKGTVFTIYLPNLDIKNQNAKIKKANHICSF